MLERSAVLILCIGVTLVLVGCILSMSRILSRRTSSGSSHVNRSSLLTKDEANTYAEMIRTFGLGEREIQILLSVRFNNGYTQSRPCAKLAYLARSISAISSMQNNPVISQKEQQVYGQSVESVQQMITDTVKQQVKLFDLQGNNTDDEISAFSEKLRTYENVLDKIMADIRLKIDTVENANLNEMRKRLSALSNPNDQLKKKQKRD